jgi:FlaA1/EpsC-like NDP-sugar epimerase
LVAFAFDVCAIWVTVLLAFMLRTDDAWWPLPVQWHLFWLAPLIALPVFIYFGLYRAVIRYTGMAALLAIAKAVVLYGVLLLLVLACFQFARLSLSIAIIQSILLLLFVATSRAMVRFWIGSRQPVAARVQSEHLLIYGAGAAGVQMAHALLLTKQYKVMGFIDDDLSLQGKTINNWPIFALSDLDTAIAKLGIQGVLLALPSIKQARRLEILESLRQKALHVRSLPSWDEIASGDLRISDIQELDIDDLLGRVPVAPDKVLLGQLITNRVVLVTGAGGSIGSELCKQIMQQRPSVLLVLDHNEFGLYTIHQELLARLRLDASSESATRIIPLLANVRDAQRIGMLMAAWRPQTVYHAAAYKHVPMVEHNVAEGIATNVLGTKTVATAAIEHGVERFVLVSTDKAVRPTNVMGASKRVAELVLQALADRSHGTVLTMVRFGNVLGSSGSVVPLFRQQIKAGGPITLTDREVTRYFMTIPEAAQLVLQAAAMARGGDVFVLDMGEPVKIYDLAKRIIELSGLKFKETQAHEGDIAIDITGLRPGEKLYEELLIGNNPEKTPHPKIMRAHELHLNWAELDEYLTKLQKCIVTNDIVSMKDILRRIVEGYQSDNDIVDWLALQA